MALHFFTFIFAIALLLLIHGNIVNGEDHGPEISYSGNKNGPYQWGSINPAYLKCRTGKEQSPIDIVVDQVLINKNLAPLSTEYVPIVNATLINHKYFIELHLGEGKFHINEKEYTLAQMHWHTPSEHRINGVQYDAESHMVHVAADGSKAVIGILYKIGKADPLLSTIQDKFVELANGHKEIIEEEVIDVEKIVPKNVKGKYYRYMGSLTTPPCVENITWTLLAKERSISKKQIQILKGPLDSKSKSNFRPVQPINLRHVEVN
ncbi:alpha carbonic anhydrase 1, chloroplastic-like [Impatiens glandulifera]|uniref:alpha carbonic anhydrase 1, chloroplastic-like n=1 Tax=Impatiens glandulifera TaxID=253017 RepID=UPI001FB16FDA|nr:alpha carbonic anhydrase 1, chloroplastic-like [Impatiens glandulifera]